MRTVKRLALAAVGLALAALAVVSLLPQPVPVELGVVSRGPLRVTVQGAGQTRVKDRFVVLAPTQGQLERIQLHPGDRVAAGQDLAFVVPGMPALLDARSRAEATARVAAASSAQAEARAQVERARVGLGLASQEVARMRRLAQSQAISAQALEQAEFEALAREKELALADRAVDRAGREADAARALLVGPDRAPARGERVAVRAPVAGTVLRVLRDSEGPVGPGTPLIELGDPAQLEVVLDLLTSQAVRVRPGARAELERWGGRNPLQARVSAVEPSGFTKVSALGVEEQRVNVLLDPAQAGGLAVLSDGYHVEGRIVVYESRDALKVPAGALFRREGGWAAFAVRDGKATIRPIEVGESNGDEVEVLSGLATDERVVLHPSDKVKDGAKVRPL